MKHLFFLVPLYLFYLTACNKAPATTILNATVTDIKTGMPIEDAKIDCDFHWETTQHGSLIGHHEFTQLKSDQNGKFSVVITDEKPLSILTVKAENHHFKHSSYNLDFDLKEGEANDVSIQMIPIDGALRVQVENQTGQHDSIWFYVTSPTRIQEKFENLKPLQYPSTLTKGQSDSAFFPMTTEEMATIHWAFKKPSVAGPAFSESIFLAKNDTTIFNLKY